MKNSERLNERTIRNRRWWRNCPSELNIARLLDCRDEWRRNVEGGDRRQINSFSIELTLLFVSTSAICTNLTVYFQFSLLVSFCSFLYKPKCCFCSCFAFLLLFFMFCIPLCFTYCLSGPCSRSNFCLLLCLITSNIDSYQHSIAPCMHTDRRLGKGKEQTKHASNDSFCFAFT